MKNLKFIIPICFVFIFIFLFVVKKEENIKNVSASLTINENKENYIENYYNAKLKDNFVSLDDALSSLNLTKEEIEKELNSKHFISYSVSANIFDNNKKIEGNSMFDVYLITTDNYYYLLDIIPNEQTFNNEKIDINLSTVDIGSLSNIYEDKGGLNSNIDNNSLKRLYNINDDFYATVLLHYNDKKTNENDLATFKFKLNVKDNSINYVNPSNVIVGA